MNSAAWIRPFVLACIALMATACATPHYTSPSSLVQVRPSKGWYKPGVTGKDAYLTWQQCIAEAEQQPGYLEAQKITDNISKTLRPTQRTDEDWKRMRGPGIFQGKYTDTCMSKMGFKYMKYPPGEQVYVPPPPPSKGWVKPGVSYLEASDIKAKCLRHEHSQEYLNHCMGEQGFIYRELTDDELPPCWYVGGSERCRPETRPTG